jgi:hypothetical protein
MIFVFIWFTLTAPPPGLYVAFWSDPTLDVVEFHCGLEAVT